LGRLLRRRARRHFRIAEQVASGVVGAIEPKLRHAEIARTTRKPAEGLDPYDLYLRALAPSYKLTLEANREAIRLLHRALEIDPSYAPAAGLAAIATAIKNHRDRLH
jgi:adenylate cyclase